ncbi:hypothetical protein ASPVEDRAFT_46306 [Aspergillus versicolor CBS 583.65]|uniref:Uncharacterized protein n=1 Tax=Aspergillus versicolor CBS 583.65 TaxID=1036611 RepID=A0A1L9PZI6_ASPVE|nr:uncharacterized protein ASPVEDRAFT_46306 [Aspergillus versicolor CBS 583.65]OJJ06938.1 hypothetical protein ASPVEDRAFT_46306 [Aspergillus versicolor CBS 583.65]
MSTTGSRRRLDLLIQDQRTIQKWPTLPLRTQGPIGTPTRCSYLASTVQSPTAPCVVTPCDCCIAAEFQKTVLPALAKLHRPLQVDIQPRGAELLLIPSSEGSVRNLYMLGTKCSERNRQAYLLLHGINPLVDLSEPTPPGIEVKVVPATIPWGQNTAWPMCPFIQQSHY